MKYDKISQFYRTKLKVTMNKPKPTSWIEGIVIEEIQFGYEHQI